MPDDPVTAGIDLAKKALEVTYPDALRPAAREFGSSAAPVGKELAKAGVTLAKTINVALAPLRGMVWGYEKFEEIVFPELGKRFEQKLHRLVTPEPNIAVPALEAMRYSADEPELRRMYVNLLETAMDKETAEKAHSAFVEIIRQLMPDEARVLEYVAKQGAIRIDYREDEWDQIMLERIVIPSGCRLPHLFSSGFGNLRRLGLIAQDGGGTKTSDAAYAYMKTVIRLTPFGKQFCAACVLPPAS